MKQMSPRFATLALAAASALASPVSPAHAVDKPIPPPPFKVMMQTPVDPTPDALRDALAHGAFAFLWNESDPRTGLTKDRANNDPAKGADTHTVASVASTGYALAALPIGVERGWISRKDGEARALTTLRWFRDNQPNEHGFYYHFVNWRTGAREWSCELSSIDSGLFLLGAITAGQYFGGEARRVASELYARADWRWMRDGVAESLPRTLKPLTLSMGWNPEHGFLEGRWQGYEDPYLYLLALGAPKHALGGASWTARGVTRGQWEGFDVLGKPSPIFWVQMTPGYFDQRGMKDAQGYDWWQHYVNSHRAHIAFCARHPDLYPDALWGVNASDQPNGYGGEDPLDGKVSGTITPTAVVAGYLFTPKASQKTMLSLWQHYRGKAWGRYGFGNALNVPKNWYDGDVIGIDLGMMLLCLENQRSGLIWKLMASHPLTAKAYRAAGFRKG